MAAAHDSNNCGLLEIPEASDWADLFGFSYHVLYDEVLWYRSLGCFADILEHRGDLERSKARREQAKVVAKILVKKFWPSTSQHEVTDLDMEQRFSFTDAQNALGDARYLMAQISPFSFSWRCDVYGNILAFLTGLLDKERALMTFRFLWGVGANEPGLVKNLYPPVQAGDPEWRSYYTVNLLNLPNHYHNGGIWPFVGGMWVRYIYKRWRGWRRAAAARETAFARSVTRMGIQRVALARRRVRWGRRFRRGVRRASSGRVMTCTWIRSRWGSRFWFRLRVAQPKPL